MSKWDSKLDVIRSSVSRGEGAEVIAEKLGTTKNNVHKICHRNGISIPRPESYQRHLPEPDIKTCLEVLRRHGYSVQKIA